jgi:allantoicase
MNSKLPNPIVEEGKESWVDGWMDGWEAERREGGVESTAGG